MIYISGPITGNKGARCQFEQAEAWLMERFSNSVINPFYDFAGLEGMVNYSVLIDICCRVAAKAESIVVLPGWGESFGSCSEVLAYLMAGGRTIQQIDLHDTPSLTYLIPYCMNYGLLPFDLQKNPYRH